MRLGDAERRAIAEYVWNKAKAEAHGLRRIVDEIVEEVGGPAPSLGFVAEWPLTMMGLAVAMHAEVSR